ncbi:hypothetical protein [Fimbriiglobus ruber]|uniref:Uncharacterized protein n=1 Tax=Fimbriiglobus ruber TaxID=1908690 RepID=A0A225DBB9_9BACT|nr:hypothetical protein [Fimbriiglobus ruber]OWK36954.1 hypothetical protein FRUB_07876 [Fimbriiglobus ruber]
MKAAIYAALRPVRARQQLLFAVRCTVIGLAAGAAAGLLLGTARLVFGLDLSPAIGVGVLAAGPVLGLIAGLVLRRTWHDAAVAVDGHYGLKDRSVTALAFAEQPTPSDLHALQLADAASHLGTVAPKSVVPLAAPKFWPAALAGLAASVALLFWPLATREAEAGPAPVPEHIVAAVAEQKEKLATLEKKLAETAQDLEDEKAEDDKKGLKELFDKLAQKLEELSQPGTDEKEALAKLSEMQAEMQALANQLNVAALDGQMSSLGSALAASSAFEGAGKALQDGKLEKAAKELDKIDDVKMTPKEAKALEEKLKQLAKQMGDAGQGSMSDALAELADSLKGGNGKVGKAAKNLAKKINNAVKRKKANDLLNAQVDELKECKCQCQNNGGLKIKQPSKSNSPSSTWGRAISGNTDGEKTKLGGKRNEQQLTGTPGAEGDSDVETTATPEAREKAGREYKEKYQKFKKESEAVLEGEPIPLGHRQMVKKYFELIRPSNGDSIEKKDAPAEKK